MFWAPIARPFPLQLGHRRNVASQSSSCYRSYRSAVNLALQINDITRYLNAIMQALCSWRELFNE